MNDKDEKIEYELKRQSDLRLPPEDKILGKARAEMRRKAAEKPSPNKSKTGWVIGLCSFAAAAVIAVVIGVGGVGNLAPLPQAPSSGNDSLAPVPDVSSPGLFDGFYSADSLTARKVSFSQANALYAASTGSTLPLPNEGTLTDGTEVMTVTVTAFKNEAGEDVLLECKLRCKHGDGYDDLTVWFELTYGIYEGNRDYLDLPRGSEVKYKQSHENGEYVSRAYIKDKYGCMLSVMNSSGYNLNYYLQLIFGVSEEGAR